MLGSAQTRLVAIVDDDASVREALQGLMRAAGFAPRAFASADDFFRSDAPARVACVVTDVRMPGLSGLELQARLAASAPGTPVIFITAHGDAEARRRALAAGARGFFHKPFDDEELVASIRTAMDGRSTTTKQEER